MSLRSAREKTERVSDAGRGSECSEESVNEAIRDCRMTLTPLRATPLAAQCVIYCSEDALIFILSCKLRQITVHPLSWRLHPQRCDLNMTGIMWARHIWSNMLNCFKCYVKNNNSAVHVNFETFFITLITLFKISQLMMRQSGPWLISVLDKKRWKPLSRLSTSPHINNSLLFLMQLSLPHSFLQVFALKIWSFSNIIMVFD